MSERLSLGQAVAPSNPIDLPNLPKLPADLYPTDWVPPKTIREDELRKHIFQAAKPEAAPPKPEQKNAALREQIISKLKAPDQLKLDALRLELSVRNDTERAIKQKEIRQFIESRLPTEQIPEAGLNDILQAASARDLASEIKNLRPRQMPELQKSIRESLLANAEAAIADSIKLKSFTEKLQAFENRAGKEKLPDTEVLSTLLQIARVLDPELKLAHGDKSNLARAMMANVADPTSIDQGGHNTCTVTGFQVRLSSREPSLASKVVADIAVNGVFVTADGTRVRPLNLAPDGEASQDPTWDGSRNYASQLFQLTAINSYWLRRDTLPGGKTVGKGFIQYAQGTDGEYLLDTSVSPPQKQRFSTIEASHPWLDIHGISQIAKQITGRETVDFGIKRWFYPTESEGVSKVLTLSGFKERLSELKAANAFPVLIEVDSAKPPFGDGKGYGPHVVTITDYDPETALVTVDNQWGKGADLTGLPGQGKKAVASDLFASMNMIPSFDFLYDKFKSGMADVKLKDALPPTVTALSVKGLRWGLSASAPIAIRSGLGYASEWGMPGAARILAASESRLGSAVLRGGSSLAALGAFAYINDLPGAFNKGTPHGVGKLTRVAGDWASFELGRGIVGKATSFVPWAPARIGLSIAGGIATTSVFDHLLGEGSEVGGSWVYERARDYFRSDNPLPKPPQVISPKELPLNVPDPDNGYQKPNLTAIFKNRQELNGLMKSFP